MKTDNRFKGDTFLDVGYIYAPYIPLVKTPVLFDNKSRFRKLLDEYWHRISDFIFLRKKDR